MSIDYICFKDKSLTLSVWDGNVTLDQWRANLERLVTEPDFSSTQLWLADLRTGTADTSITERETKKVTDFVTSFREKFGGKKMAIIAGEERRLSQLVGYLLRPEFIAATWIVFNDLPAASAWLGIDLETIEQAIEQVRVKLGQQADQK